MRYFFSCLGLAVKIALVSAAVSVGTVHAATPTEVAKARRAFMDEDVGRHWRVLANYVKNDKGSFADVEKSARAISGLAIKIPSHFPQGTGRDALPDDVTRALPSIWKDWSKFEAEVQRLAEGSEQLAKLARDGNKDAVVELIGPSGSYNKTKIGCAECHASFQGPRAKK